MINLIRTLIAWTQKKDNSHSVRLKKRKPFYKVWKGIVALASIGNSLID